MNNWDINFEDQELSCSMTSAEMIHVFGGEVYLSDDYKLSEYGIQFDNLTIRDIQPPQLKRLGLSVINSLMTCGHDFTIDRDVNGYYLKEMNTQGRV